MRWNVRDGVIFGLILVAWICALIMFLHKWGSFRLPQPRSLIRRFRPMNVDDVRVINKENKSVIYKSYSQRMNTTMGDRRKRLEERQRAAAAAEAEAEAEAEDSGSGSSGSTRKAPGAAQRSLKFALFTRESRRRRLEAVDSLSPASSSSCDPSLRPMETDTASAEPSSEPTAWRSNKNGKVTVTTSVAEANDSIV